MKAAMCVAVVCVVAEAAAGAQFASLSLGSVTPASVSHLSPTGEGTQTVGVSGDIGPFFPGPFTVTIGLTFDSFSVPGDGVAAFLTVAPEYSAGSLAVTGFQLQASLFDGPQHVSSLTTEGDVFTSFSSHGAFDLVGIAHAFDKGGAGPFEFIGDHGFIQLTLNFLWTGAADTQTLRLNFIEGSEVSYLTFVPGPGAIGVLGVCGGALAVRRRR